MAFSSLYLLFGAPIKQHVIVGTLFFLGVEFLILPIINKEGKVTARKVYSKLIHATSLVMFILIFSGLMTYIA